MAGAHNFLETQINIMVQMYMDIGTLKWSDFSHELEVRDDTMMPCQGSDGIAENC